MSEMMIIESNGSFFAVHQKFANLEKQDRIEARTFLAACEGIVQFVDLLGTLFAPVSSDIKGNITKIRNFITTANTSIVYLDEIVAIEDQTLKRTEFHIGTDALLWLKRSIDYIFRFLQMFHMNRQQACEDLTPLFSEAYSQTLEKHHNWFIKRIFHVCLRATPGRNKLLQMLKREQEIEESTLFQDIEAYVQRLDRNIQMINALFDRYQLPK